MLNLNNEVIWKAITDIDWKISPKKNYSLKRKTSIGVGGCASFYVIVSNYIELKKLFFLISLRSIPWFIIGNGTNLLIKDSGFSGIIIRLKGDFSQIEAKESSSILVGAGIPDVKLAHYCLKKGLSGLEFLSTIPGTLGGAVYMNAGAHGEEISRKIEWVEFLDENGVICRLPQNSLNLSYRSSIFQQKRFIILKVKLTLHSSQTKDIKAKQVEFLRYRQQIQPVHIKTWGSVFTNPTGKSAGQLIEACGLKGKGIGQAVINQKHANFIENIGGATFNDLIKTIEMAQNAVKQKFGILLHPEGKIIPED